MLNPQDHIFSIRSEEKFLALALETFRFQSGNNPVYSGFLDHLGGNPEQVTKTMTAVWQPAARCRHISTADLKTLEDQINRYAYDQALETIRKILERSREFS